MLYTTSTLRRTVRTAAITLALLGTFGVSSEAMACPNCKLANESESNRPKAYMYSILFMIGMPATIFTGFGLSFYRMTKRANMENAAAKSADDETAVE